MEEVKETDYLEIDIRRSAQGLRVWLKADPRLEEFFKAAAQAGGYDPLSEPLSLWGNTWKSATSELVRVYRGEVATKTVGVYVLDEVCQPLLGTKPGAPINLSFLRFEGISRPEGIGFFAVHPYNYEEIIALYRAVANGLRALIRDYLVEVNVIVKVSTKEVYGT